MYKRRQISIMLSGVNAQFLTKLRTSQFKKVFIMPFTFSYAR